MSDKEITEEEAILDDINNINTNTDENDYYYDMFNVNLQINANETITLKTKVNGRTNVTELKEIIMNERDILNINDFDLKCNLTNTIMEPIKELKDYDVIDGRHIIYLIFKVQRSNLYKSEEAIINAFDTETTTSNPFGRLNILDPLDNHRCYIDIPSPDARIFDIKMAIYNQININVERQELSYCNKVLHNHETLNQYGIKGEYVLCLKEKDYELAFTPNSMNTVDPHKTGSYNDNNNTRNVGMCVCITACITWFCASISDCFCGICSCIGDCCSNMCECIGDCCSSMCECIGNFNPCVCLFMIVWCAGWFGGSGFAAYSGGRILHNARIYNEQSSKETCQILSIESFECTYSCNCDSDDNCDTCKGTRYDYTAISSKCGQTILQHRNDLSCPQQPYTLNSEYKCWVLDCNDTEFALSNPGSVGSIIGGIILLLVGICFICIGIGAVCCSGGICS